MRIPRRNDVNRSFTNGKIDRSTMQSTNAASCLKIRLFPPSSVGANGGGKIVGHFQVNFPEEIVHAAGLLPFKVRGAPIEAVQADSRFGSYLCSILKTSLELALSNTVPLEMFVTHPICDAARNLGGRVGTQCFLSMSDFVSAAEPELAAFRHLSSRRIRQVEKIHRGDLRRSRSPTMRCGIRSLSSTRIAC